MPLLLAFFSTITVSKEAKLKGNIVSSKQTMSAAVTTAATAAAVELQGEDEGPRQANTRFCHRR